MASALFSFIDSIGETFEGVVENVETVVGNVEKEVDSAVQQIDAGVDLDDVLEEIELAGTDETAFLAACKRLEGLAQSQTATILHGWVVEDRVVPVVCAALCRVESAKLAAGPLARTLNGMGQALDSTGTTPEELRAFHEQIVRRTENGKAMMKLLQAQGVASRTQGLALLRRVYPETSSVLGRHLLSDPESISALMQILQDAKNNTTEVEEVALCAECVQFLRLVTAKDSDVRMIVTFQDGVEALLAIAAHALSAGSSAGPASVTFLSLATDACVCVLQLVGQGPVAQKYMREAGHLLALIRSLRAVVMAAGLTEAGGASWALGVRNVATVLLEAVGSFVSTAGIEAEQNSKALVQSTGFVELVCEVLQYHFDPLRLQAVQILTGAVRAAPEPSLGFFNANIQGGSMLDFFVATVLGKMSTPLEVRAAIEVLLAAGLERSADVRKALVSALEAAQLEESPGASGAGMFLLAFRMADQRIQGATQNACGSLDANTWFAARLLGQCIRSDVELRQQLTRKGILGGLLGPTAALARAWRADTEGLGDKNPESSAGLCAMLQLLAESCEGCPEAAQVVSCSPAQLPELLALLEIQRELQATAHVRGLAALVLGTCLLELPQGPLEGVLVDAAQLMELIASHGVDTFTRASEDFQRRLSLNSDKLVFGATTRYWPGFQEWATLQFQKTQDAMVRIWLDRGRQSVSGIAEDVAEHFKDLIKMQDKELRELRDEVQVLKTENMELRKLTTDEDKTLLLWKVAALSKQCEALQVKCDLLEAGRSSVEVARLRERQINRQEREELEQQLQVLALALDEAEMSKKEKLCFESEGSAPLSAAAERDELLKVLSLINRSCPEAAGFLEPLGHFVPSSAVKEVSAWEAAAERVGKQAEVISELAAKHSQSVLDLQERAALREAKVANGWHAPEGRGLLAEETQQELQNQGLAQQTPEHEVLQQHSNRSSRQTQQPGQEHTSGPPQTWVHHQETDLRSQQQGHQERSLHTATQDMQTGLTQDRQNLVSHAQTQQLHFSHQEQQQSYQQQAKLYGHEHSQEGVQTLQHQQSHQQTTHQRHGQDSSQAQYQQQPDQQATLHQQHGTHGPEGLPFQQQQSYQHTTPHQQHRQEAVHDTLGWQPREQQSLGQEAQELQQQDKQQAIHQKQETSHVASYPQQQQQQQQQQQARQDQHSELTAEAAPAQGKAESEADNQWQNPWGQLPAGWVAYSTAEGHVFYHNQSTGQSQWERPA